jgi:hypothetical protein
MQFRVAAHAKMPLKPAARAQQTKTSSGNHGRQRVRQNCRDVAGVIGLVMFKVPPGSVLVETETHDMRFVEV